MRKSTSRILYLIGLPLSIFGAIILLVFSRNTEPGVGQIIVLALSGVGSLLCGIAGFGALVKLAKLKQWGWFGFVWFIPFIGMIAYIFVGPETPALPMEPPPPGRSVPTSYTPWGPQGWVWVPDERQSRR